MVSLPAGNVFILSLVEIIKRMQIFSFLLAHIIDLRIVSTTLLLGKIEL